MLLVRHIIQWHFIDPHVQSNNRLAAFTCYMHSWATESLNPVYHLDYIGICCNVLTWNTCDWHHYKHKFWWMELAKHDNFYFSWIPFRHWILCIQQNQFSQNLSNHQFQTGNVFIKFCYNISRCLILIHNRCTIALI